ncbi:MAG: hypothetical protein KKF00_02425, partial [Proteobacteria bacterium]|nr:hypothetical protein [Pseudomonadota bacterium]
AASVWPYNDPCKYVSQDQRLLDFLRNERANQSGNNDNYNICGYTHEGNLNSENSILFHSKNIELP